MSYINRIGQTGSGKTPYLNLLSDFITRGERIITIEDSDELQIKNIDNIVHFEMENEGPDGKSAITIRNLIKFTLRRLERIIVKSGILV